MAGTMDKIKAKVDNVLHKDKTSEYSRCWLAFASSNISLGDPTGPHDSHAANKADPRQVHVPGKNYLFIC